MTVCQEVIGVWVPHVCGGAIVQGFCQRCGAPFDPSTRPPPGALREPDIDPGELDDFQVFMPAQDNAMVPDEWSDPWTDFS